MPDIVAGGWDFGDDHFWEIVESKGLVPRNLLNIAELGPVVVNWPVVTVLDHAFDDSRGSRIAVASGTIGAAADRVRSDIESFRFNQGCDDVIVIYLGSPSRLVELDLRKIDDWDKFLKLDVNSVPSACVYVAGAIEAGCSFIDFTPSAALESPAVQTRAYDAGVQLAGRDGSTGETMLKAAVAGMLAARGLRVESWFSSNHLGNTDGQILSDPAYSVLKMADKKRGVAEILGDVDVDHVVSIDFLRTSGDRKESFDSVVARDLFGGEISIRLNWQGWDSALAAPLLVDLIKWVWLGERLGLRGIQSQLGFYFKGPFNAPCEPPDVARDRMVRFYVDRLDP